MMELLQDTHNWFALSFVVFLAVAWVFGRKAVLGALDSRIAVIRDEIKAAESLHAESKHLLAEYQMKHESAVRDAAKIAAEARKDADKIRIEAEAALEESIRRREKQLDERLSRMKQSAIAEIQQYAADIAAQATAEIIAQKLDGKTDSRLIDRAIGAIGKNVH